MGAYILSLMVTLDQELAIQTLFTQKNWQFIRIDQATSSGGFNISGTFTLVGKNDNAATSVKSKELSDLSDPTVASKKLSDLSDPTVASKKLLDLSNPTVTSKKSDRTVETKDLSDPTVQSKDLPDPQPNVSSVNDGTRAEASVGMDTTSVDDLHSLGITVKEEVQSEGEAEEEDALLEYDYDTDTVGETETSITTPVNTPKKRRKKSKALTHKKRRTVNDHEVKQTKQNPVVDNVNEVQHTVKEEAEDSLPEDDDDLLALLEELPDIKHISEIVPTKCSDSDLPSGTPPDIETDTNSYVASLSVYYCKWCQYTFPELKHFEGHKRKGQCFFVCQFCQERFTFRNFTKYQDHLKDHCRLKQLCKVCGKKFSTRSALSDHERRHTGQASYHCCGHKFYSKSHFLRHQIGHYASVGPLNKRFKSISETDIEQLRTQSTERTTDSQTKWAVNILKAWMSENNYSSESFEDMTPPCLDWILQQFYPSLVSKKGGNYSKSALVGIRAGLNRYLSSPPLSRLLDIKYDRDFIVSNQVFTGLIKGLKKEGKDKSKHKEPITEPDQIKLYESGVFALDKPVTLQNKVLYEIIAQFRLRGREGLPSMKKDSFVIKTDSKERRYLTMANNEADETHHGVDSREKAKERRMYAEPENEFCPLTSYEKYISKLHPECDSLFQRPYSNFYDPTAPVWFQKVQLGIHKLSTFMARVSEEANLSTRYTNHCIRAFQPEWTH